MDLDKAFKRTEYSVVLASVVKNRLTGKPLSWIQSFLQDRSFVSDSKAPPLFRSILDQELHKVRCFHPPFSTF